MLEFKVYLAELGLQARLKKHGGTDAKSQLNGGCTNELQPGTILREMICLDDNAGVNFKY